MNLNRSNQILAAQSNELVRLKKMVVGLGCLIIVFSSCGFVVFDVYLLSNISESRMHFLDRTLSYLLTSLGAMLMLRNMQLNSNFPDLDLVDMDYARSTLINISNTMTRIHSLNYISPPTQRVADFYLTRSWTEKNIVGGYSEFDSVKVNFWDLMNDFISAIHTVSQITVDDLKNSDYSADKMSVEKRSYAFMLVTLILHLN